MAKKKAARNYPSGGHVRGWRKTALEALPSGTDEEVAQRVTELAREAGYTTWADTAEKVKASRSPKSTKRAAGRKPSQATTSNGNEGEALGTLRQLVQLLGREQVKKIIDTL